MACATLKRSYELDPLLSPGGGTPKRRRCGLASFSPVSKLPSRPEPTSFGETSTKLTSKQIAANIRDEIKRLQRRKQLCFDNANATALSSGPPGLLSPTCRDQPLFTFRQIGLICERIISDREAEIRVEYDRILNEKLADQYSTFVKFTYDYITKKIEKDSTPTYLS